MSIYNGRTPTPSVIGNSSTTSRISNTDRDGDIDIDNNGGLSYAKVKTPDLFYRDRDKVDR